MGIALTRFSSSLSVIHAEHLENCTECFREKFDTLIVSQGGFDTLSAALPLLREGGAVYWEVKRSGVWSRFRHPKCYSAFLESTGCRGVELYWHRPSFSLCQEIIPFDRPQALRFAFGKVHAGLRGRLKMCFGQIIRYCQLLPYVIPCFSIVGTKSSFVQANQQDYK